MDVSITLSIWQPTFFQTKYHKNPEYPVQMPALNDRKPSDFLDWQNQPEDICKSRG